MGRCGMGRPPGGHAVLLLRLVLPYVRHLKGEDDKPLPPSKPRKQYKMAKEPRGDDGAPEKLKKAKEEKRLDQVSSEPASGHQWTLGLNPCPHHGCRAPCPGNPEPALKADLWGAMSGLNSSLHLGHQALCPDIRLCLFRGQNTFGKLLTKVLEGRTEALAYAPSCHGVPRSRYLPHT